MGFAHEYATAIMRRGRIPMEPADWVPDWGDRPRKGKFFPGVDSFPLPDGGCPADATLHRGLYGPGGERPFDLPLLGAMLRDSYGLVGRRLAVQANTDLGSLPFYRHANWSRGTASGGGLYPVGVHWVTGPSGPLAPGVYYYSTPHHSMQRLLAGDVTGEVRAALGGRAAADGCDQFLVLGVSFWQNAFKYNSFCYHAVTMDVGTVLGTWRLWARAAGAHIGPHLWFDEPRLGRLLGLDADEEGLFAVVPLRWRGAAPRTERPVDAAAPGVPRVRLADQVLSRRVTTFETVQRIHAATLEGAAYPPAPGALTPALPAPPAPDARVVALPEPPPLDMTVRAALRHRRSSFGRFEATEPIDARQLSGVLAAADGCGGLGSEPETAGQTPLTSLYVIVNHVSGVARGLYRYDRDGRSLRLVKEGDFGAFLQKNYFLSNYNVERAAAVLVPAVRTHAVLDAVGDRGYRLVNATVGAVAQSVYTASAALSLGCGVALGFDSVSFAEQMGQDDVTGELPLLIMMIGHERPRPADFRYDIA